MTSTCPAGHASATDDYCDSCGAAIEVGPTATSGTPCPGCGDAVSGRYCESCGYDLEAGTPASATPVTLTLSADRAHWERMVGDGEPAFPSIAPSLSLVLDGDSATLGRARPGEAPDLDLVLSGAAADGAVSHHQLAFERDEDGWSVRDADSANGTWINDATAPLAAGEAHRLADGDRILIGAWTCLTVHLNPAP
jgi:predicted RNA-binding Zn-ribbon protein involved in translation (DUF1610 family)